MKLQRVLAIFPVDEILPRTNQSWDRREDFVVDGVTYSVKMSSTRFTCFKQSPSCVVCGLTGTKMVLEYASPDNLTPNFNLYAEEDGEMVLMTQDHIVPDSKGGLKRADNHV
jgi:5-methylcytosine-specific restriction endonuclease McrA